MPCPWPASPYGSFALAFFVRRQPGFLPLSFDLLCTVSIILSSSSNLPRKFISWLGASVGFATDSLCSLRTFCQAGKWRE